MRTKSVLSAFGIAVAIVLGLDYMSFAASGHSLILGRSNSANQATSVSRTNPGATLVLNSRPGSPPLRVNRPVKAPNLNADRIDSFDSSQLALRRAPLQVLHALQPMRHVAVGTSPTVVRQLTFTVAAECGGSTRHTYLLQHESWWQGSGVAELSLTVDSANHQFGEGTTVTQVEGFTSTASARKLILAPGSHTVRVVADRFSGTSLTASDMSLRATNLGHTCAGGPTSRIAASSNARGVPGR